MPANQVLDTRVSVSAPIGGPTRPATPRRDWRATLSRFDQPLAVAWVTLSIALAFNFFGGIVTLAWMRRRWERRNLLGVPVFVSQRTGPAVVGAVSPAIVVPEWVLALEQSQLALLMRHEQEHRRAGDGRLLTVAELALIAMPWNLALWWQILRLRVAVELDCDARVLQDTDARSYGDLLLEVARPRRGPRLMGATAFAERATQLERRIRVLGRHRVRTSRAARLMATCIGLAAVTVAWAAPRPPVPARASATTVAPAPAMTPVLRTVLPPTPASATKADRPSNAVVQPNASRKPSDTPMRDLTAALPQPVTTKPNCVASGQDVPPQVDSIFFRLFDGIALTSDQQANVCALLIRLQREQTLQDLSANVEMLANQLKANALRAQRDSALRAMLTSDADRATFDARAAQPAFGRARSGGPPPDFSAGRGARGGGAGVDTLMTGRGGGAGRRGGGGGGGRGFEPSDSMRVVQWNLVTDVTFRRFFEGIQLTADQEASARALITRTQQEMQALRSQPAPVRLRVNPATGLVMMEAESIAALLALVTNDADRAKLEARITTVQFLR